MMLVVSKAEISSKNLCPFTQICNWSVQFEGCEKQGIEAAPLRVSTWG